MTVLIIWLFMGLVIASIASIKISTEVIRYSSNYEDYISMGLIFLLIIVSWPIPLIGYIIVQLAKTFK